MATAYAQAINDDEEVRTPLVSDTETLHTDWEGGSTGRYGYYGNQGSRGAKSCFQRHKRKLLIGSATFSFVAIFLVLLGVTLSYTVAPGIIRKTVNEATLTVSALSLTNPKSDQIAIAIQGSFDRSSPVAAYIAPAEMSLIFDNAIVGHFLLPQISFQGTGHKTPVSSDSVLRISNMTAFSHFSKSMIQEKELVWSLKGTTSVHVPLLFGLKVKVEINKQMTITGLDGLKFLTLEDVVFTHSTPTNVILAANVKIRNPSVVSLNPIGKLSLQVYYQGNFMGLANTGEARLTTGENTIPAQALITPSNLNSASELISNFLSARPIDLTVVAAPNVSSIPLYNAALQGLTVTTNFVQTPPLQLIPFIDVLALDLAPVSNETAEMTVRMRATIANPLGPNCPLFVKAIQVNTSLLFNGLATGHFLAPTTILKQNATSMEVSAKTTFYIDKKVIYPGTNSTTAFSRMLETLENQYMVTVAFFGSADISANVEALGDVDLKRLIVSTATSLKGLDRLKGGTSLGTVEVPGNAPGPKGSGLLLTANGTLNNPSVLSMHLGDVDMDMFANGTFMGRVTCENFAMVPGSNAMAVAGVLKPSNLTAAAAFFRNYLTGIDSKVIINGALPGSAFPAFLPPATEFPTQPNSLSELQDGVLSDSKRAIDESKARYNIDWLNDAITSLSVEAIVPAKPDYQAITSMVVVDLTMDLTPENGMPIANGSMRAYYAPPFGFPFTFLNVSIDMDMTFNGTNVAHMLLPWHGLETFPEEKAFEVTVYDLPVHVSNAHQFSLFMLELFLTKHTQAGLVGLAAANVDTHMGVVPMSGVPFSNTLYLNGTNRFQTPPVTVADLNLQGGEPGFAFISLQVNITNPSSASLIIGRLVLSLIYNDTYVGNGTIENMVFNKGLNSYPVKGVFVQLESNREASRQFLSQFVQGHSLPVALQGTMHSTNITLLQLAMANLIAPATLPGFDKKLIVYAQLIFDLGSILVGKIPAQLTVFNPFDADIAITAVRVNVMYKGGIIALINTELPPAQPIVARNHSYSLTPVMYGTIEGVSIDFFRTLTGTIKVDVNGTMDVRVGTGFTSTLDYIQNNVTASFQAPPPAIELKSLYDIEEDEDKFWDHTQNRWI